MTDVVKFQFDTSFDDEAPEVTPEVEEIEAPPPEPTFSAAEVEAARDQGFQAGRAAEADARAADASERIADATRAISETLTGLGAELEGIQANALTSALSVARAAIARAVPATLAETASHGIEEVVRSALSDRQGEPRVVIRVAEEMFDHIQPLVEDVAKRTGFAGQTIVLSEPGLSAPDCAIEWADGGMNRDSTALAEGINDRIDQFIASIHGAPEQPDTPPTPDTPVTGDSHG